MNTNASRFCTRCGKDLTDAASMECGVGPICRKLDNALLAQLIPANVQTARLAFAKVKLADIAPVCMHTLALVDTTLIEGTNDWRETVKRIEWVLSHSTTSDNVSALYAVVELLGYTSLVSMWLGEAASGKALIACEAGRLWIKGPNNAAGRASLKAIKGRVFHPKTATTPVACWSVPASQHEAFKLTVLKHWPNNEGLAEAIEQAQTTETAQLSANTFVPSAAPKAQQIKVDGEFVVVTVPYNAGFIAAIKQLPYKDRSWNPTTKAWTVKLAHQAKVTQLVAEFYNQAAA